MCKAVNIPFHNQGVGSLSLELSKEKRNEVPIPMESREQLLEEEEGKCANPSCQTLITLSGKSCHCDHIIPRADGGSNELDNLQLLCVTCHLENVRRRKKVVMETFVLIITRSLHHRSMSIFCPKFTPWRLLNLLALKLK